MLGRFWRHATPAYTIVEDSWTFLDFVSNADLMLPNLMLPDLGADIVSDRSVLNQFINEASHVAD